MKVLLTIGDHLTRIEMMHRDRVALVDESGEQTGSWGEITYARLVELVRAQAAGLDRLGVGRSEPVAVLTRSSARLLTSFLAISGTGRVLLPVDFRMSVQDIAGVIDHSGATTVLVDPEYDNALFHGLAAQHFVLGTASDAELYRFGVETEPWDPDDDAIAILEYANGAIACTEPVALTHGDLRADLAAFGWQLDLSERDVYLHTVPLCHTRAWGLVYALTAMGGRHVAFDNMDGLEILRRIDAYGVTLVDGAPVFGMTVLGAAASWDGPVRGRDRLRVVLTGAPPPTTERLDTELGWELVHVDGLAKPSPVSTPRDRGTDDEMQPPAAGMAAGT
ncbi:MAG: AMP-binding protein [Acidimicrobiia bacterium]